MEFDSKFKVTVIEVVGSGEDEGLKKFTFEYIFAILQLCQGASSLWRDCLRHSFPSWKCLCSIYTAYTKLMMDLLAPLQSTIERLGLLARFLWMLILNAFFTHFVLTFILSLKKNKKNHYSESVRYVITFVSIEYTRQFSLGKYPSQKLRSCSGAYSLLKPLNKSVPLWI